MLEVPFSGKTKQKHRQNAAGRQPREMENIQVLKELDAIDSPWLLASSKHKQHQGEFSAEIQRWREDRIADNGNEEVSCKDSLCSCVGGFTADCTAVCCCPFTLVPLVAFVCFKLPLKLATKLRKSRKKSMRRTRSLENPDIVNGPVHFVPDKPWEQFGDHCLDGTVPMMGFGNSSDWRDYFGSWRSTSASANE